MSTARNLHPVPEGGDDDPGGDETTRTRYILADGPANLTWLRSELGTDNHPGVFLRGGQLAYVASITDDGYIQPRHPEDDNGPATVTPLTPLGLSTRISDRYQVEKWDANTKKAAPTFFPKDVCERAMESVDELPYVRTLRGVTRAPAKSRVAVCRRGDTPVMV